MLGGHTPRGLERATRGRLSDVGLIELRSVCAGREQCIAPKLPGRVRRRPDPKRRLYHLPQHVIARVRGEFEQPLHLRLGHCRAGRVESLEIGPHIAAIKPPRARQQHGRRRRHRLHVLLAARREARRCHRRCEEREQPIELVRERRQRRRTSGRPGRAMLRTERAAAETVDRVAGHPQVLVRAIRRDGHPRDCAHRAGGIVLQVSAPPRRPKQHDGADPGARGQRPAFEAVRDCGVRRRDRDGQDEQQQCPGRERCDVAVDNARHEYTEPDHGHHAGAQPRVARADRAEGDEHRPYRRQCDIGEQPR